jgi:hypothetical protein
MRKIDPMTFAIYSSAVAAINITELLPDTDLCDELRNVLCTQCTLIQALLDGDRLLREDVEEFILECDQISQEMMRIKNAIQK